MDGTNHRVYLLCQVYLLIFTPAGIWLAPCILLFNEMHREPLVYLGSSVQSHSYEHQEWWGQSLAQTADACYLWYREILLQWLVYRPPQLPDRTSLVPNDATSQLVQDSAICEVIMWETRYSICRETPLAIIQGYCQHIEIIWPALGGDLQGIPQ